MRLSIAAIPAFASAFAIASADVITLPMQGHVRHDLRNPAALTSRYLQKRDVASMPLTNVYGDVAYTLQLGLGTPVQTFHLMIDTGSPITWVIGNNCRGSKCSSIANVYNPVASTSSLDLGKPFSISYVGGSGLTGEYYQETYSLGPLQFNGIIGSTSQYNSDSVPDNADGILGLWFATDWQAFFNLYSDRVPFLNILGGSTSTLLTNKVMGLWLQHQDSPNGIPPNTSAGGELTFGGLNPDRYTGTITYINCVGAVLGSPWSIPVGGMTVGGNSIDIGINPVATIDTGTTLMLVSETVSDAINSVIPGAQKIFKYDAWFLPCDGTTVVTITFGTFTAQIPYTHMAVQRDILPNSTSSTKYCMSAVMYPSGQISSISNWLVGDLFLKNVYTVFDFGTRATSGGRIGFAQLSKAAVSGPDDSGKGTPGTHSSASNLLSVGVARVLAEIAIVAAFIL